MSDYLSKVVDVDGYKVNIYYDEVPYDPRTEYDNLGKMYCAHRRYNLGDVQVNDVENWLLEMAGIGEYADNPDYYDRYEWSELIELAKKKIDEKYIVLPLYLYDHGGITMNTTGFSCRWDSGQVGYIMLSKEDARKQFGRLTQKKIDQIEGYLKNEVEIYDDYLTGNVYRYVTFTPEGDELDSCGGFFGDDHQNNGLMEYALNSIECEQRQREKIASNTFSREVVEY